MGLKLPRLLLLTVLAMSAFAANSLLCRVALRQTTIDAASFTLVRISSGALALWLLSRVRGEAKPGLSGNWLSALALSTYAAAFSFAYQTLAAGTGALLLFGAVQATMILWGWSRGERLHLLQMAGLALALSGLVWLVAPGISAPSLIGSLLMLSAGIAWGIYSWRGRAAGDPASATTGNFVRAVPLAAALSALLFRGANFDAAGVCLAAVSGVLASGVGYVIWYTVLPHLRAASAATVQLVVPVLAAAGGILLLGETLTFRFCVAAVAVLSGIAMVVLKPDDLS